MPIINVIFQFEIFYRYIKTKKLARKFLIFIQNIFWVLLLNEDKHVFKYFWKTVLLNLQTAFSDMEQLLLVTYCKILIKMMIIKLKNYQWEKKNSFIITYIYGKSIRNIFDSIIQTFVTHGLKFVVFFCYFIFNS